jgi:hypothetical protein
VTEPYRIDPGAWYDDDALCKTMGLKPGSLGRNRRAGRLKFTRAGGRVLYLGRWVLEWLTREPAETQPCG